MSTKRYNKLYVAKEASANTFGQTIQDGSTLTNIIQDTYQPATSKSLQRYRFAKAGVETSLTGSSDYDIDIDLYTFEQYYLYQITGRLTLRIYTAADTSLVGLFTLRGIVSPEDTTFNPELKDFKITQEYADDELDDHVGVSDISVSLNSDQLRITLAVQTGTAFNFQWLTDVEYLALGNDS